MAVRIPNRELEIKDNTNSAKPNRPIKASLFVLKFAYSFALIAAITSLVALIFITIFQEDVLLSQILFAQWSVVFGIVAAIASSILKCADICVANKNSTSAVLPGKYLKRAALLLVLFFLVGSTLTYLIAACVHQELLQVNFNPSAGVFPVSSDWELALGIASEPRASKIVGLDFTPLICSLFLWVMSYVVNYLVLRSNQSDHVV